MKKIAMMYSGLPIANKEHLHNHIEHIYQYYDCDIFMSLWRRSDEDDEIIEKVKEYYKPKVLQVEDYNQAKVFFDNIKKQLTTVHHDTQIKGAGNTLSMHYKIFMCFGLVPPEYDIVVKNRTDVTLHSKLNLDIEPYDTIKIPSGGDHRNGVNDVLAFGPYDLMEKYCGTFLNAPFAAITKNYVYHPENLLRLQLSLFNISVTRFPYLLTLRGWNYN